MNEHLLDIIEHENEHSCLDFKKSQYVKGNHKELLKDVIAMANAISTGNKYIVIGIKHLPDGNRDIYPIEDFIDSSTYQQLIQENIEPELHIKYEPYQHEKGLIGIIDISDCNNPPYLLKKDFDSLKKGDCFIRKGSHQTKISRSDLDKIYELRNKKSKFSGAINIGFANANYAQEITLPISSLGGLPSQVETDKIREILETREKSGVLIDYDLDHLLLTARSSLGYKYKNTESLRESLANIKEIYTKDDQYEIIEIRSSRLNFEILNNADEYIQDAVIRLEIPKNDDCYMVAKKIPSKFVNDSYAIKSNDYYPKIEFDENKILISQSIKNIKHQMVTKIFGSDIRLTAIKIPENGIIPIDFKLFAKNLPSPIYKKLTIRISNS